MLASIAILFITLLFPFCATSEITYIRLAENPLSTWKADSLFIGLGLVAADPVKKVEVIWQKPREHGLAKLFFLEPHHPDSATFLFHNRISEFPNESKVCTLGQFDAGTNITFMYQLNDTVKTETAGKKFYSGQNRRGIDPYISEIEGALNYRWAVAGRVRDNKCEMSFSGIDATMFGEMNFLITNVYREELDKYRVATPEADPPNLFLYEPTTITLTCKNVGDPKIYYTMNGERPDTNSTLYEQPFTIADDVSIKAIAVMPGDTQWIESEVMYKGYSVDATKAKNELKPVVNRTDLRTMHAAVYNLQGRRISENSFRKALPHTRGVFLVDMKKGYSNQKIVFSSQ